MFYLTFFLFLIFTIWLNLTVKGNDVNVDRWSAMDVAIKALLNNEYPYSAIDHMNGRTSNLPTLILIGIPFYFLGDVGYLQTFSFVIFTFLLAVFFNNYRIKTFGLLLIIFSSSFGWEIYVKSDLMSNFIIILSFIILIQKKFNHKIIYIIITAIISSSLLLTRLVSIIPLSLTLLKKLYKLSTKNKIIFISTAIATIIILLIIAFKNFGTIDNFTKFNPFTLQNRQLPFLISLLCIIIPLFYSFRINNIFDLIKYTVIFLSIPILLSFTLSIINNGIYNCIFNSYYDISYLNIIIPFSIFQITLAYDKLSHSNS